MDKDMIKEARPEDFKGDFREIVDVVGIEKALAIIERVGGTPVYVPRLRRVRCRLKSRAIEKAWIQGEEVKSIARKFRVSETWAYRVVKKKRRPSGGDAR